MNNSLSPEEARYQVLERIATREAGRAISREADLQLRILQLEQTVANQQGSIEALQAELANVTATRDFVPADDMPSG